MNQKKRNLLTVSAIVFAVALFAIVGIFKTMKTSQTVAITSSGPELQAGLPSIGGSFELTDKDGKVWKDTDFKGKPMLVYFGYAYCPDICPTALYHLTQAVEELGGRKVVQPIFITLDPERDTVAQLQSYAQNFHKDFIMLTGARPLINQVLKAYRVYAARASNTPDKEAYLLDHSSLIYLMDKQGHYLAHFNHQTPPEEIVARVRAYIEKGV